MFEEFPPPVERDRPFPWRCFECGAKEVVPLPTDYTATVAHDERTYAIRIPDLAIPTCRKCGERVFTSAEDDRIRFALRAQIGLLTPQEIQGCRARYELTEEELAELLGVSQETIACWEAGSLQSRAMDNLLRLFFQSEEVRSLLRKGFAPSEPALR